ncbi:double zinc ribbon domain-containing protein, partial [Serratia marcescens]
MIVKRWAGATVALALPPRCPGCATPVEEDHRFCADCWSGLRL